MFCVTTGTTGVPAIDVAGIDVAGIDVAGIDVIGPGLGSSLKILTIHITQPNPHPALAPTQTGKH